MISRHDIRRTAIQFLYGVDLDSPADRTSEQFDDFWNVILESYRVDLRKVKVKAIEHLTRDYQDKLRIFEVRAHKVLTDLTADPNTSDLRESLEDIVKRELSLDNSIKAVRTARKNDPDAESSSLEECFLSLSIVNATLLQLRERFLTMIADYPTNAGALAPLVASMRRMQEISCRLDSLDHPEKYENKSEIHHVLEIQQDMVTLRDETEQLIKAILPMVPAFDETIVQVTDNFAPERISPVDRAILRVAAYELQCKEDLPVAVVIKEAIRLSERFSVKEAPKFINGVLAGIARIYRVAEMEESIKSKKSPEAITPTEA
ncbi:MAG: transcription antitermination protein NusB [Akkermansia sp.]